MACINTSTRARLIASLAKKEAQLLKAEEAYDDALTSIKEYRFDSGEGSQRTEYRSVNELKTTIDALETEIEAIHRRLNGTGLVNINLRRKRYGRY